MQRWTISIATKDHSLFVWGDIYSEERHFQVE